MMVEGAAPTIWFTGLSRSGKTTIAEGVASRVAAASDRPVQILDGSFVRDEVGNFFGYSREERVKVSRILAVMAKLLSRNGVVPIVTAITPYEESREFNRAELDPYVEVYVDCPVEVCMERDELGLYQKALRGDLPNFIGVDVPFEIPKSEDLVLHTAQEDPVESVRTVLALLVDRHPALRLPTTA